MKFSDLPPGTLFFDIDGIAVARLPDSSQVAFSPGRNLESRPYPRLPGAPGSDLGDLLSREEFSAWLELGFNRFDVRSHTPEK